MWIKVDNDKVWAKSVTKERDEITLLKVIDRIDNETALEKLEDL